MQLNYLSQRLGRARRLQQIITAAPAAAFVVVVFSAHLPAAAVPGCAQLRQPHRLSVAAVVADAAPAVVAVSVADVRAGVADPERRAFFLVQRALRPLVLLRRLEARPADEVLPDLREIRPVPLLP